MGKLDVGADCGEHSKTVGAVKWAEESKEPLDKERQADTSLGQATTQQKGGRDVRGGGG